MTVEKLKEKDELNNAYYENDDDFDKIIDRQGELTELLETHYTCNLDKKQ